MNAWTPPNRSTMPTELTDLPRWVCWRAEERQGSKPTKVPYNAKQQGRHASTKDPNTWADFDTAWQSYEASLSSAKPFTGVGFVLFTQDEKPERRIGAIDIDGCINEDGEISPQTQTILDSLAPAYVEFSPSGKGLRAFGYVAQDAQSYAKGFEGQALELYTHGRYLTLTGDIVGNYCAPLREISNWKSFITQCETEQGQADLLVQPERAPMPEPAAALSAPVQAEDLPALQRYMQGLPNPNASYDDYLRVGMALHHATEGSAEGLAMWNAWAAKIANYHSDKQGQKWHGFGSGNGKPVTAGTLLHMGQKWGHNPPEAALLRQAYSVTFNADDFGEIGPEAEQDEAKAARHPFAQVVPHSPKIPAVEFVLQGFIQEGAVTIAGARGIGKTSALMPLACAAAGFHREGETLAPKRDRWRHVVYIAEDTGQADRIIRAYCHYLNLPNFDDAPLADAAPFRMSLPPAVTAEQIRARVHLVEARRLDALDAVSVGWYLRKKYARFVDGVEILPLVVFDTLSAAFDLENENDNTEAARLVAALMQDFAGCPVWLVSHIAKAQEHNSKTPTMRGGGALEGNTVQNLYLVAEGEGKATRRYLQRGKTRFVAEVEALELEPHIFEAEAVNRWGETEQTRLICAIAQPCKDRAAATAEAAQAAHARRLKNAREGVIQQLRYAQEQGINSNREWLKSQAGICMQSKTIVEAINELLAESVIKEVPALQKEGEATNNNRKKRLVITPPEEREAIRAQAEQAPESEAVHSEAVGMNEAENPDLGGEDGPRDGEAA